MVSSRASRRRRATFAGAFAGLLAGAVSVPLAAMAVAQLDSADPPTSALEASHLPPLLVSAGEAVELRYDAYCLGGDEAEEPCDATGSVFVRAGDRGRFAEIELREEPGAQEGRLVARVPATIARSPSGLSYYAVLTSARAGSTVTLPAGAPDAPQRIHPHVQVVTVDLGTHLFGRTQAPSTRVAHATWGDGAAQTGLEEGRNAMPVGGSSFDVDAAGAVHLLDEANRRVLRWPRNGGAPVAVPLDINGTIADLAVSDDGAMHVLETTGGGEGHRPLLRAFEADGSARASVEVAERSSQLRLDPEGRPTFLAHPSGQWMRAWTAPGKPLDRARQLASGRAGRPVRGNRELVVLRHGNDVRLALVGPGGTTGGAWSVASGTDLAEVQLAELVGERLLVVVRVYSESADEFLVLLLDRTGLVRKFAVDPADWAETAPLSRFRVAGTALFRLGSSPAGVFVDRFDLEVE